MVSDLSSTGHFVDLGQENASAWSPPPEAYLENTDPARRAATKQDDKTTHPSRTFDPRKQPPRQPHAHTRRNDISRSGRKHPLTPTKPGRHEIPDIIVWWGVHQRSEKGKLVLRRSVGLLAHVFTVSNSSMRDDRQQKHFR